MSPKKDDRRPAAADASSGEQRQGPLNDPAYGSLRDAAVRILENEGVDLSRKVVGDILRLVCDVETAHSDLKKQGRQIAELTEALDAARHRFHDLYETAPVAFVTLAKGGFIEMCNGAARRMLLRDVPGPTAAPPLVGRRFSSFVAGEDLVAYYNGLKRMAVENKASFFEIRLAGAGDRPTHVHVQASPKFDERERFAFWHLALSDISDLRRSESRLRALHEQLVLATHSAGLGLWHYDLKSGTSAWNDQLYRLLGLEPRPGPEQAEYFFEFIHPEDRTDTLAGLQSVLAMEGDQLDEEFRIVRADDGRVRWLACRGKVSRDEAGGVLRIAGVNYDITERKEADDALRRAHRQLNDQLALTRKANEELSQYAYAVSHDLKGPLRAIRNYADFLDEDLAGTLEGEPLGYLRGLQSAVRQGENLVGDLLNYSRIGRMPLEPEAMDLPALVEQVSSGLGLTSEVEIEVQRQWPEVRSDRVLMRQILHNLVSNAVKFNRRNPKRIRIGCREAPEGQLELFVRDNGIGIAPEHTERIFRIFQRLHTEREYEGTGIGLAIVGKAAATLGGSVRVESEAGEGSTFYVRLPKRIEGSDGEDGDGYEI